MQFGFTPGHAKINKNTCMLTIPFHRLPAAGKHHSWLSGVTNTHRIRSGQFKKIMNTPPMSARNPIIKVTIAWPKEKQIRKSLIDRIQEQAKNPRFKRLSSTRSPSSSTSSRKWVLVAPAGAWGHQPRLLPVAELELLWPHCHGTGGHGGRIPHRRQVRRRRRCCCCTTAVDLFWLSSSAPKVSPWASFGSRNLASYHMIVIVKISCPTTLCHNVRSTCTVPCQKQLF